ncbi:hypothetical protein JIR001_31320 [Polycladomyces abyssicola]|uniref:Uncharacterized protein n=1 Tax=Polycladomyces abyssicola TaxID=1125966 RepID=A0A8D5UJK5_9BACL|nr:hypothetical protein JIR001_31320 [Polycladomyces abyssicola]
MATTHLWDHSNFCNDPILDRINKLDAYRLNEEMRLTNEIDAFEKRMEDRAKRGRQQVEERINQNLGKQ